MAFNTMRFLLNRAVIRRQGVPEADTTRLALVPSLVEMPLATSLVVATVVGRNAAPPPAPPVEQVVVPKVVGQTEASAKAVLEKSGLEAGHEDAPGTKGQVVASRPKEGDLVDKGGTVVLVVGAGDLK